MREIARLSTMRAVSIHQGLVLVSRSRPIIVVAVTVDGEQVSTISQRVYMAAAPVA
jgi:hypothetical protein